MDIVTETTWRLLQEFKSRLMVRPAAPPLRVKVSRILPFPETAPACDLQSRCEVSVPTGRMMDAMADIERRIIYLSQQRMDELKAHITAGNYNAVGDLLQQSDGLMDLFFSAGQMYSQP